MKWIFLLAIFAFLQYVEVKGYPQSKADKNLHTRSIAYSGNGKRLIKRSIPTKSNFKVNSILDETSQTEIDQTRTFDTLKISLAHFKSCILFHLTNFDTYMTKELVSLEKNYKQLAKHFQDLVEGLNTKKGEKSPSLGNTVLNNKTEENVVSTTPTNKLTSTETASDNKTEENVVSTTSTNKSTSTETASNKKMGENVVSTTPTNESTNIETASNNKTEKKEEDDYKEEDYEKEDKIITNYESMYTPYFDSWKNFLKKFKE